ncbi:group II intron reverse transcriptase/maturase [Paenibacillus alkaliterrae]|uniref:group II intron reverse transcriptase/maturase n=1 Tax=Paenibacillus alkaliterrae TaxID=320909 RepID=UPI001F25BA72|nr:group II intron reverse transcriptase/maturase [Paenibacillus alkaliterrae]MCF2940994.1 group II intron reverse transcriptase/maturase [Paenibacillus alkaliterrae]
MNAGIPANYTKAKVRELQITLYLAAKASTKRRFHALYDKVYRLDVLTIAWKRVKANGGSAGVDQMTIDYILKKYGEERFIQETQHILKEGTYRPQPVRRKEIPKGDGKVRPLGIPTVRDRLVQMAAKIVTEPVFEADFKDSSFGFRPKRDLKKAIERIRDTVNKGSIYWVVDIDITAYFDNIPHDKLMKMVEQRISDRRILKLIRQWLTAGVMKDGEYKETDLGSPQGGVISPLLSNLYLHYLDTIWENQFTHLGTLVRYADDLVVLCHKKEHAKETIQVLKAVFQKLELTVNQTKSKVVNLWKDEKGFDFLGYHHRRMPVWRKGGNIAHILRSFPSKKVMKKMRDKIKDMTSPRHLLLLSINDMIRKINPIIQGWSTHYKDIDTGISNKFLRKIDWFIRRRLMIFWNKKHKKRKSGRVDFFQILKQAGLKTVSTWG